jgi:hypothetical protein
MPDPEVYTRPTQYQVSVWPGDLRDRESSAMDADMWAVTVEYRGMGRWAVLGSAGRCLSAGGEWDWEPRPSSRDDDWLAGHRFALDDALALAREHAPKVTINGMTALEVLARHQPEGEPGA